MDLEALLRCLGTRSCVVTQLTSGMIIGMLLFLIASGVTLIFGVLNVINFAHGSLYMVGRLHRADALPGTGSYFVAALGAARGGRRARRPLRTLADEQGLRLERADAAAGLLRRRPDLRRSREDHLGPECRCRWACRPEFRLPPIRFMGGVIPPFYLFMIGAAMAIGLAAVAGHRAHALRQDRAGRGRQRPDGVGARHPREPLLRRRLRHRQRAGRRRRAPWRRRCGR